MKMLSNLLLNNFKIMPSKKLADKNIRKLTRMGRAGSSLGITIPKEIIKELSWRERQRVIIKRIRGGFTVKDYRSKK